MLRKRYAGFLEDISLNQLSKTFNQQEFSLARCINSVNFIGNWKKTTNLDDVKARRECWSYFLKACNKYCSSKEELSNAIQNMYSIFAIALLKNTIITHHMPINVRVKGCEVVVLFAHKAQKKIIDIYVVTCAKSSQNTHHERVLLNITLCYSRTHAFTTARSILL